MSTERVVSIGKKDHSFVAVLGHREVQSNGSGCIVKLEQELCNPDPDINVVLVEASITADRLEIPLIFEVSANAPLARAMKEGYHLTQP